MYKLLFLASLLAGASSFAQAEQQTPAKDQAKPIKGELIQPGNRFPQIQFDTNIGMVVVELNRNKAPLTVNNFLQLVASKAYDNTIFHRVIKDFVVQGGGVTPRLQQLPDTEAIFNESGNGLTNEFGTIAMARQKYPHSASRQFYFNVNDLGNKNLDPSKRGWGYTVFGEVITGEEVLLKMAETPTGFSERLGWPDVPMKPLILKSAIILPES